MIVFCDTTLLECATDVVLRWQAIELHFDPTGAEKDTDVKKEDSESHEPLVDAMVERKREQLAQYRKEVERRHKLAAAEAKKVMAVTTLCLVYLLVTE